MFPDNFKLSGNSDYKFKEYMLLRSIAVPLTAIRGIGPELTSKFVRLDIRNIADLLRHYPRNWLDWSVTVPIREYQHKQVCTEVSVIAHDWVGFGNKRTFKVYVEDQSGRATLCFFRPYKFRAWLEKQYVPGRCFRIMGSFKFRYGEIQSSNCEVEPISTKCILPVHPLTAGLNQADLRDFIRRAIKEYAVKLEDEIPAEITERDKLLSKAAAIRAIHFPASFEELAIAKKTLIYEELFYLEVMVGKRVQERRKVFSMIPDPRSPIPNLSPLQNRLLERLPFSLTPGQQEAITEINAEMTSNTQHSMARLLQGDVGSGKTLVSFLAMLKAAEGYPSNKDGGQTALMAPTELLARQHAENAARLLEPLGLRIAFLTGNIRAAGRKNLLKHLAEGEINLVVGTHALFSNDVIYKNLRLVVIDEQHRFGVTQRSMIMAKGKQPHLLMMSATPIPRTLALTVFGDMDVSVIRDMPPGRKPVKTHLAKESSEAKVYDFVREKLETGSQAYFVYPLIDSQNPDDDDERNQKEAGLKAAVSMAERLAKNVFPRYSVALIHSKLDDEEKRQTMERFRNGEIRVLVATSVVEVGVDVPNANCMVIEHAERFGLSALHQLRGRVGRGQDQAYCFLVYSDELTDEGKARLKVMLESTDGFIIAEEDLKLRGPGQIAGTEQSGYLNLGIANPIRDVEELARARTDAFFILENDPGLVLEDHRIIARVLEEAPPFEGVAM
jgi:ATP-dependent DNA helicase RecG